jgi:hypothetical protein
MKANGQDATSVLVVGGSLVEWDLKQALLWEHLVKGSPRVCEDLAAGIDSPCG